MMGDGGLLNENNRRKLYKQKQKCQRSKRENNIVQSRRTISYRGTAHDLASTTTTTTTTTTATTVVLLFQSDLVLVMTTLDGSIHHKVHYQIEKK